MYFEEKKIGPLTYLSSQVGPNSLIFNFKC